MSYFNRSIKMFLYFSIASLALGDKAFAQLSIQVSPNNTPILGTWGTYTVVGQPPNPIASVQWQYRPTTGSCSGNYGSMTSNNGQSVRVGEAYVGTFQVQAIVTFQSVSRPGSTTPPPQTVGPVTVTVAPPDGAILAPGSPASVTVPLGQQAGFTFVVQSQGQNCGSMFSGRVQEKITQYTSRGKPATIKGQGTWINPTQMSFLAPNITDFKMFNVTRNLQDWQANPNGFQNSSYKMQMQLLINDACGNEQAYPLPNVFNVTNTKASGTTVTFTVQ